MLEITKMDNTVLEIERGSDWEAHLLDKLIFRPHENCQPNWFHRKMQYLILGIKWKKVPKQGKKIF